MNGPQVTVIGNITNDPVIQYTADQGKAYLRLTVAGNRYTGEDTPPETNFFDFTLWESRAENASVRLVKGDPVYVSGPLSVRRFQRQDGSNDLRLSIQPARDFHYMTRAAAAAAAASVDSTDQADPATPVDPPEPDQAPEQINETPDDPNLDPEV